VTASISTLPPKRPLPKTCVFCGERGRQTREDFWPEWFRAIVPRPPDYRTKRAGHTVTRLGYVAGTNTIEIRHGHGVLHRNGDMADQTLRVVCDRCNNGWMSRLQERAKPHLEPLIRGMWVPHGASAQSVIAQWATMFTMVIEFADEPTAAYTFAERKAFHEANGIPDGTLVWIGRSAGENPNFFNHRSLSVSSGPPYAPRPNAQMTTFTAGKLLLQVFHGPAELRAVNPYVHAVENDLLPIWPLGLAKHEHGVERVWSQAEIEEFARSFGLDRAPSDGPPVPTIEG
jgi:hypothetical protein